MSYSIIVKALDNFLNEQIVYLLNCFGSESQKPLNYDSMMQTINNVSLPWPLRVSKVMSMIKARFPSTLTVEDFLAAADEQAITIFKSGNIKGFPPVLLQAVLILRFKKKIETLLEAASQKISQKKPSDGLVEDGLHKDLLRFLRVTKEDLYIPYVYKAQGEDEFCCFLDKLESLIDQPFQSLLEHHHQKPIFLDQNPTLEAPFVNISRNILISYLLLAQLPSWTYKCILDTEGKVVSLELVLEDAKMREILQTTDVAQHKVVAALGLFYRIHLRFSDKAQHGSFSAEEAQGLMSFYLHTAAQTRGQGYGTRAAHLVKDVAGQLGSAWSYLSSRGADLSSGGHQRLEALLGLLHDRVCVEQFPTCNIELIKQISLSDESGGFWSLGKAAFAGLTSLVSTRTRLGPSISSSHPKDLENCMLSTDTESIQKMPSQGPVEPPDLTSVPPPLQLHSMSISDKPDETDETDGVDETDEVVSGGDLTTTLPTSKKKKKKKGAQLTPS